MNKEIEVRFLEIDKEKVIARLQEIGAKDLGKDFLKEIIFYDTKFDMRDNQNAWLKLRSRKGKNTLTYKRQHAQTIDGHEEIETEIADFDAMTAILEKINMIAARRQEKWRHTFVYDGITFDIDTWPQIPTYIEIEADSEEKVRAGSDLLEFDWNERVLTSVADTIKEKYGINTRKLKFFTFDKIEELDQPN